LNRQRSNPSEGEQFAVIDLFSGPGGLSLGLDRAGFRIATAVECDRHATETYRENFPETELISREVESVDGGKLRDIVSRKPYKRLVLVGGPPCQPFSTANLQNNGSSHPSASAVDHFARLVEEVRPDAFLFENVTNFQSIDKGESLRQFLRKLGKEMQYKVSLAHLNSEEFGVPQRRVRLYIGGVRGGLNREFDLTTLKQNKRKMNVEDAISDLPFLQDGGGGSDKMGYPSCKKPASYQRWARKGSRFLYNHWSSKNSAEVVNTIRNIVPGLSLKKSWSRLPETVKKRYKSAENIHSTIYRRLSWATASPTIVHPRRAMLLHPSQNRIITVREAARLQSFPDKFRFRGGIHDQYQQVANAVPPLVAEALAHFYIIHLGDA
jgi:DNA (cytosine-5)-methyltransferase 1